MPDNPDNLPETASGRNCYAPIQPRWRCRPDGSQEWRRLALTSSTARELRFRAGSCGVTTDAWLNIAFAVSQLGRSVSALGGGLEALPAIRASDPRLRSWQDYLRECDGPGLSDELPEVVFSHSASDSIELAEIDVEAVLELGDSDWDLARRCEIRAAGLGQALPEYMRAILTRAMN
jgi:hypothetical protein